MDFFFASFFSTVDRRGNRRTAAKEAGEGHSSTDPILDARTGKVCSISPSDISTSGSVSVETSIDYDDYPSYPAYEDLLEDFTLEADGVMAIHRSARAGVSVRRRVRGSLLSIKKGLKRMANRKHAKPEKATRHVTLDQDDESVTMIESVNCEPDAKRPKTIILPRLQKKFRKWATSIKRSAPKSRNRQEIPKDDYVVSEAGTRGTRPKPFAQFLPLDCGSLSFDVNITF